MSGDSISVAEASRLLYGDQAFVFSLILRGELRPLGSGAEIRVSRGEVEKYSAQHPAGGVLWSEGSSVVYGRPLPFKK
jgi:hypothetical protein